MEIYKTCEIVIKVVENMTTAEKVLLFKDIFNYPINTEDGRYYYSAFEWEETRMKDFLKINLTWMKITEFERLYDHFKKTGLI
jgi:hypothetical protein